MPVLLFDICSNLHAFIKLTTYFRWTLKWFQHIVFFRLSHNSLIKYSVSVNVCIYVCVNVRSHGYAVIGRYPRVLKCLCVCMCVCKKVFCMYFEGDSFNILDAWAYQWRWLNVTILCSFVRQESRVCQRNLKFQHVRCVDWSELQMDVTCLIPSDGIFLWHLRSFRPHNRWVDILGLGMVARLYWLAQMHAILVFHSMHATIHRTMTTNRHHMLLHHHSRILCRDQTQRWTSRPVCIQNKKSLQNIREKTPKNIYQSLDFV